MRNMKLYNLQLGSTPLLHCGNYGELPESSSVNGNVPQLDDSAVNSECKDLFIGLPTNDMEWILREKFFKEAMEKVILSTSPKVLLYKRLLITLLFKHSFRPYIVACICMVQNVATRCVLSQNENKQSADGRMLSIITCVTTHRSNFRLRTCLRRPVEAVQFSASHPRLSTGRPNFIVVGRSLLPCPIAWIRGECNSGVSRTVPLDRQMHWFNSSVMCAVAILSTFHCKVVLLEVDNFNVWSC